MFKLTLEQSFYFMAGSIRFLIYSSCQGSYLYMFISLTLGVKAQLGHQAGPAGNLVNDKQFILPITVRFKMFM